MVIEVLAELFMGPLPRAVWWWFGFTGSFLVLVLSGFQHWHMEKHPHASACIGLVLHVLLIWWLVTRLVA